MVIVLCHLGTHAGAGVGLGGPRFHKPGQVSRPTLEVVAVPHLAAKGGRDSTGICLPAGPRTVAVPVLHVVGNDASGGVRTAPGDVKVGGLAVGGSGYLGGGRLQYPQNAERESLARHPRSFVTPVTQPTAAIEPSTH
ncbi:MAG: hypothetical protein GY833_09695 [Aestuariibacter sp.]|nr:hypothetical protein [Aestuariibacter sp.]